MCDEGRDVPEERKPELCLRGEVVAGREHTKRREVEAEENISRSTPCWLILHGSASPPDHNPLEGGARGADCSTVAGGCSDLWTREWLSVCLTRFFLRGRSSY